MLCGRIGLHENTFFAEASNLDELNGLLADGWKVEHTTNLESIPANDGSKFAVLIILKK